MIRFWLGLALLGGSWLFGLKYYHEPDYLTFSILIIAGSLLLWGALQRLPGTVESFIAIFMLVPVAVLAPGPYRAIPILIIAGLLLNLAPFPVRWPRLLGSGAFAAGIVLLCQSLAMQVYEAGTARSHDVPAPIAKLLLPISYGLVIDAGAVVAQASRQPVSGLSHAVCKRGELRSGDIEGQGRAATGCPAAPMEDVGADGR